ncbi:N-acetyltransferase [Aquicoccus sp. SU-CL01552]|uniref:GNAT family N-acetyltransferase n=1 Tax=Aquicoccus sp. SU-CL01552 TaxID=3127656 RepID=UPI003107ED4C
MTGRPLSIRPTRPADHAAVLDLHSAAFGPGEGQLIADLVAVLLDDASAQPRLSLLARRDGHPLGHILFTRATLAPDPGGIMAALLSPLAVHPKAQGQGIGGRLIREGLTRLRDQGCDLVFVLGHPGYYPRYGFRPCRTVSAPYPIPTAQADAWMVRALSPDALDRIAGARLGCAPALDRPDLWAE